MKKTPSALAWGIFAAAAVTVLCASAIALTQSDLNERSILKRTDGQQLIGAHYVSESDVASDADIASIADIL